MKTVSGLLIAGLLLIGGAASAHTHLNDHEHGRDAAQQCPICFLAQNISSADQTIPIAVFLRQELAPFPASVIVACFRTAASIYLEHPAVHGPPAA